MKQEKSRFIITSMKIGEFEVPVPVGLSDLLNDAGMWVKQEYPPINKNDEKYDRVIEKRNGKIVTRLTLKHQKDSPDVGK